MSEPESNLPSAPSGGGRGTRRFAFAALAVAAAAFAVITAGGIGENLVYYWGPSDIQAAGAKAVGATIRLGGQVKEGSVEYSSGSELAFDVTDGKADVRVLSHGVPPQMFREGIGVVVEGTMTSAGHFECNRLMVSHDNEYRVPEEGYTREDMERVIRSTKGLEADVAARP